NFRGAFGAAIAIVALGFTSTVAQASYSVCNRTQNDIKVAYAHTPKDAPGTSTGGDLGTTAEGWFSFKPGECGKISDVNAANTWLYLRSQSAGSTVEGSSMLCIQHRKFTIQQQFHRAGDRCGSSEFLAGFVRVNADKTNWTTNIK